MSVHNGMKLIFGPVKIWQSFIVPLILKRNVHQPVRLDGAEGPIKKQSLQLIQQ
jgi:hypothetical protein